MYSLFPLPYSYVNVAITVVGIMGALALIYAVLLEAEKRQDAVIVVGAASLFLYAWWVKDIVFMFVSAGMFLVALRELIQIMRGKHLHTTEEVKEYERE